MQEATEKQAPEFPSKIPRRWHDQAIADFTGEKTHPQDANTKCTFL